MPYAIHIVKFNGSPKRLQSTKPPDLYHLQYWHRDIWARARRAPRTFSTSTSFVSLLLFSFFSFLLLFSTSFCSVSPARPRAMLREFRWQYTSNNNTIILSGKLNMCKTNFRYNVFFFFFLVQVNGKKPPFLHSSHPSHLLAWVVPTILLLFSLSRSPSSRRSFQTLTAHELKKKEEKNDEKKETKYRKERKENHFCPSTSTRLYRWLVVRGVIVNDEMGIVRQFGRTHIDTSLTGIIT